MRNLPQPTREHDRVHLKKAVKQYRYRGQTLGHDITDAEIDAIVELYDLYEQGRGAARDELKGVRLPNSLRETIHNAYGKTQEGRTLHAVRDQLFTGVDLCPVCGIDPATELDHHLPQSEFKPLAIHVRNLIPMCHSCNHAKLAGFEEGGGGFLHPYYDLLPDVDFLQATIDLDGAALVASFTINAAAALPAGFMNRLTGQMTALKLKERYQQEVNMYITSHAAALHLAHRSAGQVGVRNTLRLQARFETQAFHRNHWRPVLIRAMANHDDFTDGGFIAVLPIPQEMLEDLDTYAL